MKHCFIPKTGWEAFDLSRAYGLGVLAFALCEESEDVVLSDKNYWYEIAVPFDLKFNVQLLAGYLEDSLDWEKPLITTKRGPQSNLKREIRKCLAKESEVKAIFEKYFKFRTVKIPFFDKRAKTLYGSMEPRSFKGTREIVRLKRAYGEGDTPKVSFHDWLLSVIGHINLTVWIYGSNFSELLSVMPIPSADGIDFGSLCNDIRNDLKRNVRRVHQGGRYPTLAYVATRLMKNELSKHGLAFSYSYAALLYGSMVKTGKGKNQQWKPSMSGIFPLELSHNVARCSKSIEIFDMWEDVFRKTNRKGFEDLAVALADFMAMPTLANLAKYINLHARRFIDKHSGLRLYDSEVMNEVVGLVRN